eukprot:2352438-Amphidinium_carterae.1
MKLFFERSKLLTASITCMPPWGRAPVKLLVWMTNVVTALSPLSGSIPFKRLMLIQKSVTSNIARMPPTGSAPAKRFPRMLKAVTSLRPLSGSIPVKLFVPIEKCITASIARMPPSGSVPAKLFLSATNFCVSVATWTTPLRGNPPTTLLKLSPKQDNTLNALRQFKSMSGWFSI